MYFFTKRACSVEQFQVMLLYLCNHKSWKTHKRRTYRCTCRVCSMGHTHRMSQGKFKAKKNSDEENANWNLTLFYLPPKVRYFALKKSSFVLASISKKCKLKSDKNINLVQNSSTGISSGILNSSYHALSGADGCVYTGTWSRSLGIAGSVLGSHPFLVTILGSQKCSLYTWAYTFFFLKVSKKKAWQGVFPKYDCAVSFSSQHEL